MVLYELCTFPLQVCTQAAAQQPQMTCQALDMIQSSRDQTTCTRNELCTAVTCITQLDPTNIERTDTVIVTFTPCPPPTQVNYQLFLDSSQTPGPVIDNTTSENMTYSLADGGMTGNLSLIVTPSSKGVYFGVSLILSRQALSERQVSPFWDRFSQENRSPSKSKRDRSS